MPTPGFHMHAHTHEHAQLCNPTHDDTHYLYTLYTETHSKKRTKGDGGGGTRGGGGQNKQRQKHLIWHNAVLPDVQDVDLNWTL